MANYRKIWSDHHGEIPKDTEGRTYEVHHVNGDGNDNTLNNLKCVSIQEHFDIHNTQNDYFAMARLGKKLDYPESAIKTWMLSGYKNRAMDKRIRADEHKKRVSESMKNVSQQNAVCPYCNTNGGISAMKRWHFDNCKEKNVT